MKYKIIFVCIIGIIAGFFIIFFGTNTKKIIKKKDIQTIKTEIEEIIKINTEFFSEDNVIKISVPRNDILVTVDNWPLDPFMGLTSWISLQQGQKKGVEIMAMGDLVLLEHEVQKMIDCALSNNILITALHNHFFYDHPKIYFMHLEIEGILHTVAQSINILFETLKATYKKNNKDVFPTKHHINKKSIEDIIPIKGIEKNGMYKIIVGREIQAGCGCYIGKNMGINTWIAFGGTEQNAIINGDFCVRQEELQKVLISLRNADIDVVAIHNHMINEHPRLLFVHFWGHGNLIELTHGIKDTLATIQ